KRNPIYHFYKEVELNKDGKSGEPGDKHYQCYHGNRKVLTISKAMNYSLNGLVGHLRSTFKPLFQLYLVMKSRNGHPLTPDEIMYASGQKPFDSTTHTLYLQELEKHTTSIKEAFLKQRAAENPPWDQERFEELLIEWVVACDQPFDEVEKPEFISLME
ncbi:hypothetical protein EDB83DRAFT_2168691, partial [Lactarius deliciosus]